MTRPVSRPKKLVLTTMLVESTVLRMTLATTGLPCISMPGAAADDVDPLDIAGDDALQDLEKAIGLAGRPLAVDQDIAGIAGEAAEPSPPSKLNPDRRLIMSIAVAGRAAGRSPACSVDLVLGRRGKQRGAQAENTTAQPPRFIVPPLSFCRRLVALFQTGNGGGFEKRVSLLAQIWQKR